MISLKTVVWISNTSSLAAYTGSGNSQYYLNHNKGRAPDRVFCQAWSDSMWKNVYTVWLEGGNYRGWYISGDGSGADKNTLRVLAHGIHIYMEEALQTLGSGWSGIK